MLPLVLVVYFVRHFLVLQIQVTRFIVSNKRCGAKTRALWNTGSKRNLQVTTGEIGDKNLTAVSQVGNGGARSFYLGAVRAATARLKPSETANLEC